MEPMNGFSYDAYELGLQQIVKPPVQYEEDEHFTFLLQHTSPEALLDKSPVLKELKVEGIIFKILNYTTNSLFFFTAKDLHTDGQPLLTFTKNNCHLIAYQIKDHPEIICLEHKNDDDSKASKRLFITKTSIIGYGFITLQSYTSAVKKHHLTQHFTHITNVKKLTSEDLGLKTLIQSVPDEALLKKNPTLLYFSKKVDSCFFTVLNHTNHEILFNINRELSIDGQLFTHFANSDCQIAVYHLENHPEIICFTQKNVNDKKISDQFFAKIRWEPRSSGHFFLDCRVPRYTAPSQTSYDSYELGLQKIVSPPNETLEKFNMLNEKTIENFTFLLQHTSPKAILNQTPTLSEHNIEGIIFKILNYTNHSSTFIENKGLLGTSTYSKNNCHLVAYHIKQFPKIICIDHKDDDNNKASNRFFIEQMESERYRFFRPDIVCSVMEKKLSAQRFTYISDVENLISKDSGLKTLIQNIPNNALLKKNPRLLYFGAKVDSCFFTILNYTNHKILFDTRSNLLIDGQLFSINRFKDSVQLVAYHLKDHPETIYFEQKYVKKEKIQFPVDATICWDRIEKLPSDKIYKDARKYRAFHTFWKGSYDDNSMLSKNQIPQDVLKLIISNYRHCK